MLLFFVKGIYLGFCMAAPVGPIGMICIRSGLAHGWRYGLSAGFGAACADAVYGIAACLGLGALVMACPQLAVSIKYLGALFLLYLGIVFLRTRTLDLNKSMSDSPSLSAIFRSTLILTLANPMTISSFIGIFSASGLTNDMAAEKTGSLVTGVFVGSLAWWIILAFILELVREKISLSRLVLINRLSGGLIIGFAVWSVLTP